MPAGTHARLEHPGFDARVVEQFVEPAELERREVSCSGLTNVPRPRVVLTAPRSSSTPMARRTVIGLTS